MEHYKTLRQIGRGNYGSVFLVELIETGDIFCLKKISFFDMAEAETEIMAGAYIEYSGKALGIFKISRAIMLLAIPALMITLYFGGVKFTATGLAKNILQYIFILVLMILIKNTNPRVRIDQAMRFFWGPVTVLAAVSVILAVMGR